MMSDQGKKTFVLKGPVTMRLQWHVEATRPRGSDYTLPRRPVRLLVHSAAAVQHAGRVAELLGAGCGVVLVLDTEIDPAALPQPAIPGQLIALAVSFPALFGGDGIADLAPWRDRGIPAGVLLGLGPMRSAQEWVASAVAAAKKAGAAFVVAAPLTLPAEDRHRAYDAHAGEAGDELLENVLFHCDLGRLATDLERVAGRACHGQGICEALPGPACGVAAAETVWGSGQLLLWARRLDLMDEMSSCGWQLRRAARALLAAGRSPAQLTGEDNLRVIPGFTPWVEAFARSVWSGGGEPFDGVRARWLAR